MTRQILKGQPRGFCAVCGRPMVLLTSSGMIRSHGAGVGAPMLCAGSGLAPSRPVPAVEIRPHPRRTS